MLDKKYIKYTRNGIAEENATTGKTQFKTSSAFNNQARYKKQSTTFYSSAKTAIKVEVQKFIQESDDTALQASESLYYVAKGTTKAAVSIAKAPVKITRGTTKVAKTVKASVPKIKQTYAKTKEAYVKTKQVVSHIGSMLASAFKALIMKPLLAGSATAFALLIPAVFITMLIGSMFGTSSSQTADKKTLDYIKQLDTDFIAAVHKKQDEISPKEPKIEIVGLERVNTSLDELLALLSASNKLDTELSLKTKKLLSKYHAKLNVFNVETFKTTTTDEKGKEHTTEKTIILVESFTVRQLMYSFNLDDDELELLEQTLDLQAEVGAIGAINGKLSFPIKSNYSISSPYGQRIDPITNKPEDLDFHTGVDIATALGTPIYPVADGVVIFSDVLGTYGNLIILSHKDGSETYYAHCDTLLVKTGENVTLSTQIATVGQSGRSTGPHLHLEVRINGRHTNPMQYF